NRLQERDAMRTRNSAIGLGVVQRRGDVVNNAVPGKRTLTEALVPIQRRAAAPAGSAGSKSAPALGAGQSLDGKTRALMEHQLDHDFSDVRVHTDGEAADATGSLHADAYTTGRNVVFASGQYDPSSSRGLQLLGHELTHVVQQSQGRVSTTAQAKGVAV